MGYVYLLLQALIFSFGGILIKTTATAFSPFMVSFLRFALGVLFLLALQLIRGKKPHLTLLNRMVVFGGIAKTLHYLGENYGVMHGFSYGNVVIWPVQTVVILLISTLVLKEKVTRRAVAGAFLCVSGIVLLTWNGMPLKDFIGGQGPLLIAFVIAGIGASLFSVCQKKLLDKMDTVELNNSMFLIGGLCAGGVLPLTGTAGDRAHPAAGRRRHADPRRDHRRGLPAAGRGLQDGAHIRGDGGPELDGAAVAAVGGAAVPRAHHRLDHRRNGAVPGRHTLCQYETKASAIA